MWMLLSLLPQRVVIGRRWCDAYLLEKITKTTMPLQYIEAQPSVETESPPLLVLLHGYGSDENDLMTISPLLDSRFRVVSVRAPIDLPQGGYAWFPIEHTESGLAVCFEDAEAARVQLCNLLVDLQKKYSETEATFLLGFSQGAGMALFSAFHIPTAINGIASLSGLCVKEMLPDSDKTEALKDKPVFMSHGELDPLIPIADGRMSYEMLATLPLRISYHEYAMGHEINQECLQDLRDWFQYWLGLATS